MNKTEQTPNKPLPPYYDGISASLGSTIAIVILQPFDLLKVRLQGSGFGKVSGTSVQKESLVGVFKNILKNEGVAQFWRGVGPTVLANGIAWGAYMHFYETFKNMVKEKQGVDQLSSKVHFMCGIAAGASQVFITNPIFLIKTRMQLQKPGAESYYTSFYDGVKKTVAREGYRGLYKGVVPALWLTSHGGIQMSAYEEIKLHFAKSSNKSLSNLTTTEIFIASSISKLIASTVLYPFQTIKTRLQDERNIVTKEDQRVYRGTADVAKKILKHEGLIGFYRGFIPNTLKVIPNSSITLLAYEEIKKLFQNANN
ncbi:hypothetical protein CYY_002942 [Polysphondylium violaceum]|uniref:Mitochondrial substrate carrier family protein n=1 Tax=Polysphondylium violaceum TaxID=133409 RepID=A0A8J4PY19_9MYCE|nr:hypothetical protein CYY_002942 [Polysphondylium violaceum]